MRTHITTVTVAIVLFVFAGPPASIVPRAIAEPKHQHSHVVANPWQLVDEPSLGAKQNDRIITPRAYSVFGVDAGLLAATLRTAPLEFTAAAREGAPHVMTLPMPDGSVQRFAIQESPVMEEALAARYPQIDTYIAQGIDDRAATVRLDLTPLGFHAQILSPNGAVYVDPIYRGDTTHYISYYKRDYVKAGDDFVCLVDEVRDTASKTGAPTAPAATIGQTLRTYRLALACTGEYSVAVCNINGVSQTVDNTFAAMTTSVNRVVGVYESELAIRMVLVANDTSLVYLNGATDPYTNSSGSTMLSQNQSTCDSVIGSGNYDIGHVFSTGGGGIAGLGVVCRNGNKANGVTGLSQPVGDGFDIDYVAHEMGHQFGANHTFNSNTGSCGGGNRSASHAYEVGSGSTIMAYAGICGAGDLQPHSDPYFHGTSFDEIVQYTNVGAGNNCPVQTSTGNNEPTASAGAAYSIPINTPFELTALNGSDPNSDALTYCWEEFDLGPAGNSTTDNGSSPILRSFNPSSSPTRVFPKISSLISNTSPYGEVLPTTTRTMTYRCTYRDNKAGGGGVSFNSTTVSSSTAAGPFQVTAPNTATTFAGGSVQTVTWNVANTTAAPVSTANVTIYLSLDGGNTFPIVLLANTPNDGSQAVTIPNAPTTQARIKVKGAGNIFFDISNANFTITSGVTGGDSAGIYVASSGASFLRNSNTPGAADSVFNFGPAPSTLVPLSGDWDGNHTNTAGLYDPATGNFFLKNSNAGGAADIVFQFGPGGAGFVPLVGDWNADGVDTIGIYQPATGTFFLKNSNSGGAADVTFSFGAGGLGLIPVAGDWDGDVKDTIGLYDPATGSFFLKNQNLNGSADIVFSFGSPGLTPVTGDWNLDGKDTIGVYVPASGTWFLRNSNSPGPGDLAFSYGPAGVTPIVGDWDGL